MVSLRKPALVALASLAAQCSTARPAAVAPTAAPSTAPALARAPAPSGPEPELVDPHEELRALTAAGTDPQLIAGRSRRYVLERDHLRALGDSIEGRFVSTAHVGGHWLYANERGLVVRSDAIDGALERVAELPSYFESLFAPDAPAWGAEGHLAVQSLATGASEGVLPLIPAPGTRELVLVSEDGSVSRAEFAHAPVSAVFASGSLGAVLLESGRVLCSTDRGAGWSPFEQGPGRGVALVRRGAMIEVRGTRHTTMIGPGCQAPRGWGATRGGVQTVSVRSVARATSEQPASRVVAGSSNPAPEPYARVQQAARQPFMSASLSCAVAPPAHEAVLGDPEPGAFALLPRLLLRCEPDTLLCHWADRAHGGGGAEEFGLRSARSFSLAPPGWVAPAGDARLRERMGEPEAWRVLATAPNGVVLETELMHHERRVYVGPDLRARWLEEPSAERASEAGLDAVYERWAFPDAWLVRPEGVYSMRMARAGDRERLRVVLRHGLDGRLAALSPALAPTDVNPVETRLAVRRGVVGLVSSSRVLGEVLFWPPDGSEPTRERAPWPESVGFCEEGPARPRPSEWLVVQHRPTLVNGSLPDWWPSDLTAELEVDPHGACVRRLWGAPWRSSRRDALAAFVAQRSSGAILVESRRSYSDPLEQRRCELR